MEIIGELIEDPYGNYVLQCIIERGLEEPNRIIWNSICERFMELINKKFSSNVIEKVRIYM